MKNRLIHKVTFNPLIENFSGKFGEITMVKSKRGIYARKSSEVMEMTATEKQLVYREAFKEAQARALADMKDANKKADWERVAKISNGRYLTPRSAAFAYYFEELKKDRKSVV